MLHGSGARIFFERGISGVAARARSLRGNKCSQNDEKKNRDQHKIPTPKSCGRSWRGGSQAPLERAILASVHLQLSFVRSRFHESSKTRHSTACFQIKAHSSESVSQDSLFTS